MTAHIFSMIIIIYPLLCNVCYFLTKSERVKEVHIFNLKRNCQPVVLLRKVWSQYLNFALRHVRLGRCLGQGSVGLQVQPAGQGRKQQRQG